MAVFDVDRDGRMDVAFTCELSRGKHGVGWLSPPDDDITRPDWKFHPVSGTEGTKFDLIQALDLNGDGRLDIVTCEEQENLGVIWYENAEPRPNGVVSDRTTQPAILEGQATRRSGNGP